MPPPLMSMDMGMIDSVKNCLIVNQYTVKHAYNEVSGMANLTSLKA